MGARDISRLERDGRIIWLLNLDAIPHRLKTTRQFPFLEWQGCNLHLKLFLSRAWIISCNYIFLK